MTVAGFQLIHFVYPAKLPRVAEGLWPAIIIRAQAQQTGVRQHSSPKVAQGRLLSLLWGADLLALTRRIAG
jgi:hypothetical protein